MYCTRTSTRRQDHVGLVLTSNRAYRPVSHTHSAGMLPLQYSKVQYCIVRYVQYSPVQGQWDQV